MKKKVASHMLPLRTYLIQLSSSTKRSGQTGLIERELMAASLRAWGITGTVAMQSPTVSSSSSRAHPHLGRASRLSSLKKLFQITGQAPEALLGP